MRKILFIGFVALVSIYSVSCKKTLPDAGRTSLVKMANGWWVNYTLNGVSQTSSPTFFSTYNVSENTTDSMWFDDLGHFWDFKGKVKADYVNQTFSGTGVVNQYYTSTADIANGKIITRGGHSRAGNITDSIYAEIQFSDDPGNTYILSGTARTGFIEDDY